MGACGRLVLLCLMWLLSQASSVLRKRMVEVERLVDEVTDTPTLEQIQLLNELGILYAAFGDKR